MEKENKLGTMPISKLIINMSLPIIQHARHGIGEDYGGQLAARQDKIADGDFLHVRVCLYRMNLPATLLWTESSSRMLFLFCGQCSFQSVFEFFLH